ncbi:MAG: 4Fe-4S binding protein [Bacillota bacterium]|nr:4Fe-4S binding protein [Bacillota bacterium]
MNERDEKMAKERKKKVLKTIPQWCKGCGICVAFCPVKILALEDEKVKVVSPDKCTSCGLCEMRCPDFAIYLEEQEDEING